MSEEVSADYDGAWKETLEGFFRPFLEFCFPEIAADIDWDAGVKFLNQELQAILRNSKTRKQQVDKIAQVTLRDGSKQYLFIHVEVQSQKDQRLPRRVYQYHYRLTDLHGPSVVTLVVLADEHPKWKPESYSSYRWKCGVRFDFLVCKLLELEVREDQPLKGDSPIAIIMSAHLAAQRTCGDMQLRAKTKWELTRRLYGLSYSRAEIFNIYRLIDWFIRLDDENEIEFIRTVHEYEQQAMTPYITSAERIGRQKGLEEGIERGRQEGIETMKVHITSAERIGRQEGLEEGIERGRQILRDLILETLEDRFGKLPNQVSEQLRMVEDTDRLKWLQRQAIKCSQFEDFSIAEAP